MDGKESITYYNNSPDVLSYLWLQLDENEHSAKNNANYQDGSTMKSSMSDKELEAFSQTKDKEYGFNILKITDALGKNLDYTINKTMMRGTSKTIVTRTKICF